jgi:aryl-alcohol dehydrogenase
MKFKAAALFGAEEAFRIVQVEQGALRSDEVLVRIVAAGICHTDLTVRHGGYPVALPIVLGHEGSGVVEQVGGGITDLAVGDPVALTFMSCGHCKPCTTGRTAYCSSFGTLNMSGFRADGSTSLCCDGPLSQGISSANPRFRDIRSPTSATR